MMRIFGTVIEALMWLFEFEYEEILEQNQAHQKQIK